MNEGDSAGGQTGRTLALPAGTDQRILSISSAGHLPVGPVVVSSPMSRSSADERQQQFKHLQPMQSTGVHQNKSHTVPNPAGIVTCNQQQFTSSTSGSNVLISGVNNVNNDTNSTVIRASFDSGVRTQNSFIGTSGSNSASDGLVPNHPSGIVSVFSGIISGNNNSANSGKIYTQTASGIVTGTGSGAGVDSGETFPVSPTARKRLKLDSPIIEVEHDISALKKLILEHKYMRLRSIKEK
ncbi:uncharacterized protein LOC131691636 [Topomyia yanbarensis]|uniref:uncharacterized protein LOC131691636 n=1 Tax=Topomyia yanbarensis TaxID=2498891 RepID=UPI00273CD2E8|nr:uncharacterized protein LOC131691636 [Topomyia yanbarensis]